MSAEHSPYNFINTLTHHLHVYNHLFSSTHAMSRVRKLLKMYFIFFVLEILQHDMTYMDIHLYQIWGGIWYKGLGWKKNNSNIKSPLYNISVEKTYLPFYSNLLITSQNFTLWGVDGLVRKMSYIDALILGVSGKRFSSADWKKLFFFAEGACNQWSPGLINWSSFCTEKKN